MSTESKKSKHRSPNFPVVSLKEAIERARLLYEKDGMSGGTKESIFKNMGYAGKSGASLGVLSALGKYGLIEEKNGRIVLTKDAALILMRGGNEDQKKEAIHRCALKPLLYKELWDEHAESGSLPGDDTLRSLLVTNRDFNPKSVDKVLAAFRETIEFAGLVYPDTTQNEHGPKGNLSEDPQRVFDMLAPPAPVVESGKPGASEKAREVRDFAIPRKGQRVAILRLEFPVSQEDIGQISKWLELMKGTISAD